MTSWISHHAAATPDRPAITDLGTGTALTYAQLDDRVRRLAAALTQRFGVGEGDRVAVLSPNCAEVLEVQYACAHLGAIFLPLNWRLAVPELAFVLDDASPTVLLHDTEQGERIPALTAGRELPTCAWGAGAEGPTSHPALLADHDPLPGRPDRAATDPWTIIYTSGTTGRPKGAVIDHGGAHHTILNSMVAGDVGATSMVLTALPLFHVAGLNLFANAALYVGGQVLVMRQFDPAEALRLLSADGPGVTHFVGVPASYQLMEQDPAYATTTIGPIWAGVGGSPSPRSLLERWHARGTVLRQIYGITEGSSTVCTMPAERALEKAGSVGLPVLHAQLRIVDVDGTVLGPGHVGELQVRGPMLAAGYWDRAEATRDTFADGWLLTGDAARLDADGFCTIVDRWKDMYISGGENVYPAEVEDVVYQIPGVAEAAVVGVPDERWGEVGVAVIVPAPGVTVVAEDVIAHCRQQLARYKVPARVELVTALPRNAIGKIRKVDIVRDLVGG